MKVKEKLKKSGYYNRGVVRFENGMIGKYVRIKDHYIRERDALIELENCEYAPTLYDYDDKEMLLIMEDAGPVLKTELKGIKKVDRIAMYGSLIKAAWKHIIEKHGLYHNDMHYGNICILNGKVKLIDWGLASEKYNEAAKVAVFV